jgi:hypothetical protein
MLKKSIVLKNKLIISQSINPMKIKEKTYDFRINKILVLELYKIFNKIDSYNIINIISYL